MPYITFQLPQATFKALMYPVTLMYPLPGVNNNLNLRYIWKYGFDNFKYTVNKTFHFKISIFWHLQTLCHKKTHAYNIHAYNCEGLATSNCKWWLWVPAQTCTLLLWAMACVNVIIAICPSHIAAIAQVEGNYEQQSTKKLCTQVM